MILMRTLKSVRMHQHMAWGRYSYSDRMVSSGSQSHAYASRAMSETERRYSQIEEALAIVWACDKYANYVVGKRIHLETDHKPLRLSRFDYSIAHVPGKLLYTADTLSRAPVDSSNAKDGREDTITESLVQAIVDHLPANKDGLDKYRRAQHSDAVCSQILEYCRSDWPSKHLIKKDLMQYWIVRGELTVADNLLLYRTRIVIPRDLQKKTLQKIHHGHQGILKCRQRVTSAVWWPGVSKEIEEFVKACPVCLKTALPHKEPLL